MNFTNAADVLGVASQIGKSLGKSSSLVSSLGGPYGKIAAQALEKIGEKAPDLIDKLQDKLKSSRAQITSNTQLTRPSGLNATLNNSLNSTLSTLRDWDSNQDGVLSENELQGALSDLESKISNQQGRADGGDAFEKIKLAQYQSLQALGQNMMSGYGKISAMDNQAGISVSDMRLLAFRDNDPVSISKTDWA